MAVPELQAFHQQTRDKLNGIALGGMKIDLQRGHRYMHPTFKGLPFNSTGSMNRMGFLSKAENDVPLENKVMAGGARTQEGQRFYQKQLKGVAEWTRNQQLMKDGLPPTPPNPEQFELPVKESLQLEFRQLIDFMNNEIETSDFDSGRGPRAGLVTDARSLARVVIRLLYISSGDEIVQMIRDFETAIEEPMDQIIDPSLRGNRQAETEEEGGEQAVAVDIYNNMFAPIKNILRIYAPFAERDDKTRQLAIRSAINKAYGPSKAKSVLSGFKEFMRMTDMPPAPESSAPSGAPSGYNTPPAQNRRRLAPLPIDLRQFEGQPSPF